jgi:hypothetical protein
MDSPDSQKAPRARPAREESALEGPEAIGAVMRCLWDEPRDPIELRGMFINQRECQRAGAPPRTASQNAPKECLREALAWLVAQGLADRRLGLYRLTAPGRLLADKALSRKAL